MTPTEQDKELQKAVWASLASQMTHAINCTDLEHEEQDSCEDFTKKNFEQLMQLIAADRKRVALGARVDSLLTAKRRIYETDAFELGLALGIIDSELKKLGWTPGELKAQQEEVK